MSITRKDDATEGIDRAAAMFGDVDEHLHAPGAQAGAIDPAGAQPGTAVAIPFSDTIEALLAPHTIDLITWARSLVTGSEYPETDAEEVGVGILASILTAKSSDEALSALDLERAKAMCGNEPGGHSPVLEITGARALKSTYSEGAPCYAIIDAIVLASGERIRFTTGARAVQAVVIAHMGNGWMPFRGQLEIRQQPTVAGYHPLNLTMG
jgi:hypothetical protein